MFFGKNCNFQNAGSCYLFQCGPPEDFKCKFTHHANYSSAVLAVARHAPDLENQIKLTKHVQELAKLRAPRPLTSTTPPAPVVPATEPVAARRCSRFQFECRANGECIAIYNACDGIAQCADGSDEAAELGKFAQTVANPLNVTGRKWNSSQKSVGARLLVILEKSRPEYCFSGFSKKFHGVPFESPDVLSRMHLFDWRRRFLRKIPNVKLVGFGAQAIMQFSKNDAIKQSQRSFGDTQLSEKMRKN